MRITGRSGKRRTAMAGGLAGLFLLLALAISAADWMLAVDSREGSALVDRGEEAASPMELDDAALSGENAGEVGELPLDRPLFDRKVISTASVRVQVELDGFESAYRRVTGLTDKLGGYVVSAETTATADEEAARRGTVTLRIPNEGLAQALDEIAQMGLVKVRELDSADVTEEFVDLEARLANARSQEQALRALLGRAQDVGEVLEIRNALSSVQAEVEQLEGRLRYLEEHASYATLTVHVYEAGVAVASTADWGFLAAIEEALRQFVGTVNAMVVWLGGALPVLLLVAFTALGARHAYRSRRSVRSTG